jgi:phage FluMu gp28-like protein
MSPLSATIANLFRSRRTSEDSSNMTPAGSFISPGQLPMVGAAQEVNGGNRNQSEVNGADGGALSTKHYRKYFFPAQIRWIDDPSPLRIMQKSRQIGASYADAYDSVIKASVAGAQFDVWISTRDETQAKLYLEDCKYWATLFHVAAQDLGEVVFDKETNHSAYVLQFANGKRIYVLSSNPDALAGKRGHVKLDEFALHQDQRKLFTIAKPVTTWGGQLSIISTHRGPNTLFNQIIQDILHRGNPMKWSLHTIPIQTAVEEGLVERINERTGGSDTREEFVNRMRSGCIDEEAWLQEYCCTPADENSAFLTHEMITACENLNLKLLSFEELIDLIIENPGLALYIGVDVARKRNLYVVDVGEKIGDVMHDRVRIELHNKPFRDMTFELHRLLRLPQVKRCCIDAGGNGSQLAEEAQYEFGWKVEPVAFTPAVKEELALSLRRDFEDRKLRIVRDDNLRSDLRALKKLVTSSGNTKFDGQFENSHCDRTWAMALRQHAARHQFSAGGAVA